MKLGLLILQTLAFILSFEVQSRLHAEAVEINPKDMINSRNDKMSEIFNLLHRFRKHTRGYNQQTRKKLFKGRRWTPRLKKPKIKLPERASNPLLGRAIIGTGSYRRRKGNRGSARNPSPPVGPPIVSPTPPTSPAPPTSPPVLLTYRFEKVGQRICGTISESFFGWVINISERGERIAIGSQSGLIKVYEMQLEKWNQIGQDFNGFRIAEISEFGFVSLSSDGNYLGVVNNPSSASTYTFDGSNWSPVGSYTDFEEGVSAIRLSSDGSRIALSVNEDTVQLFQLGDDTAIAEIQWPNQDDYIMSELSGDGKRLAIFYYEENEIRVYEYNEGTNSLIMMGSPIVTSDVDSMLLSVSLSYDGGILALSGLNYDARVFEYNSESETWRQKGTDFVMTNDSDAADDYSYVYTFSSLTDAGDRIAVSHAILEVSATAIYPGQVVIHDFYNNDWNRIGSLLNTFASVDISPDGSYFAIGSFLKSTDELTENGCVTVFQIIQN